MCACRLQARPWPSATAEYDHCVCRRFASESLSFFFSSCPDLIRHQFKLDRGLNGKLARLLALEDAINIDCRTPIGIELVNSVGQEAANFSEGPARVDSRNAEASCQRYDLCTMDVHEGIWHYDQATILRSGLCGNDSFKFGRVPNRCCDRLHCEGRSSSFERV